MGSKLTKTDTAGKPEFQHEKNQTMLMYTLVKVFNVFVRTLNASGNVEFIFSMLRTCDESFDKFFILLLPYCGKLHDEFAKSRDLKVHLASQVLEGVKEPQYFLIIELTYVNMNKILPHCNLQMAITDIKTDPVAKPELQPESNQAMLMHTLLKIVHVFVRTMNKSGNFDLNSIPKDHTENFGKFFVLLLPYCEKFSEELTKLDDLKVQVASQVSEGVKEKQYFLNIELKYINKVQTSHGGSISKDDFVDENVIDVAKTILFETTSDQTKSDSEDGCELENPTVTSTTYLKSSTGEADIHEESFELENMDGISNTSLRSEKAPESSEDFDLVGADGKEKSEERAFDSRDVGSASIVEQKDETSQLFDTFIKDLKQSKVLNAEENRKDDLGVSQFEKELGKVLEDAKQNQEANESELESLASTQQFSAATNSKEEEGYNSDKENTEEFQKELESQSQKHQEELDKLRKEREEKKKRQEDELNKIRNQQKQCFRAFIECMKMKKRFEEMENEWSDGIEMGYKRPVVRVINKFHLFLDETRNVNFGRISEDSLDELKLNILSLDREVLALFNILENIFSGLENVVSSFEDAMFPRVLQNSVCVIAAKLRNVLETLEEMGYSTEWFRRLEEAMLKIKLFDVPTVTNLRETCKTASMENYELLKFPQRQSSNPIISEVDIDDTPDSNVEKVQEPMEEKVAEIDLDSIEAKRQRLQSEMERKDYMPPLEGSDEKNVSQTTPETSNDTTEVLNCGDELKN